MALHETENRTKQKLEEDQTNPGKCLAFPVGGCASMPESVPTVEVSGAGAGRSKPASSRVHSSQGNTALSTEAKQLWRAPQV
mmetsp:Transcript_28112/g.65704  ORF Transcript_28112/g.65704 Transcript_28112/m.65704 type:complete len:82 (+) Transcript_28112:751-996(+)